ncbi:hypothetical protein AADG42_08210 [Ammonicoccus fulvus]|uniref:Uncharacterized protein n=1 Tax=Ammonicoccus fulvus TaxID=3138240 RepID=A0ABZ3FQZ6_9ACTN
MITIAMNQTALLPAAPVLCGDPKRLWREPGVTNAAQRQSYALFTDHERFGAPKRNPLVPRPRAKLG